ncbi:MAG: tripartite tricarboxylate transporter substrate binding protein [Peptococcaceae bacterium]
MKRLNSKILLALILLLVISLVGCGNQQPAPPTSPAEENTEAPEINFPERTVTITTWSSPGGGGDVVGRALAGIINQNKLLPQNMLVENRPGAGHINAINYVAKAKPDGYNLLFVTRNLILSPYAQDRIDLNYEAFEPVIGLTKEGFMIITQGNARWDSLEELLDEAKENPNTITWGGGGHSDKMVCDQLQELTGAQFKYVQFEGGGEQTTAAVGGHVDIITCGPPETITFLEAGQLKYLANVGERSALFPDVPGTTELGYNIGSQDNWRGIVAPKGTPKEVIEVLYEAFNKALEYPEWETFLKNNAQEDMRMRPEDFWKIVIEDDGPSRKFFGM